MLTPENYYTGKGVDWLSLSERSWRVLSRQSLQRKQSFENI